MKPEYLTYDIEELAQDADFIRWVKQSDTSLVSTWDTWLQAHPEQAEKVDAAKALVKAVEWPVPSLSKEQRTSMWDNIAAATTEEAPVVQLPARRRWLWSAAAAAVLVLSVAGWWWMLQSEPTALFADRTEQGEFALPDGSVVSLNAVTEIRYAAHNWNKERRLRLEGEAFFQVEKGVPFIVETPYGTVEVLGTSFNVEARADVFRVNCYTGKVRVSLPNGESETITPKQGVEAVDGQLLARTVENENDIAWQQSIHHFTDQPLREVFAELERQYLVQVSFPETIRNQSYTGSFKSGELETALQSICWPLKLSFTINQNQVQIRADQ
ncbi:MAG: FecR domain-containing protein [Bacteroidota bacterium]